MAHSSSGLGRGPLTAETRVRFPDALHKQRRMAIVIECCPFFYFRKYFPYFAPKRCKGNHSLITFALKPLNMTIREWIRYREISGFPTFSVEEIRLTFPNYSEQVIKNELFRLSSQGILYPAYKAYYVQIRRGVELFARQSYKIEAIQ